MALLSTLTDTFVTVDAGKWAGSGTLSSGRAAVAAHGGYLSMYSVARYDATGSYLAAQLTIPVGTGFDSSMRVVNDSTNYVAAEVSGATLRLRVRTAGADTSTVNIGTYSATTDAYWRLRFASGTAYLDTSPDGTTWTARANAPHSFAVTSVLASFNTGSWGGNVSTFYVDNVNQPGSGNAVQASNTPPALVTSPSGADVDSGAPVMLGASGTSGEGAVTVAWTQTVGPTVTLTAAGQAVTFTAPRVNGSAKLTFVATATGPGGLTTTKTVTVNVWGSMAATRTAGGAWSPARTTA